MTRRRLQAVPPQSVPVVPSRSGTGADSPFVPEGNGVGGNDWTGNDCGRRERLAGTTAGHVERSLRAAPEQVRTGSELAVVNVRGGSREKRRGAYCTPKYIADALGPFDHDPFSNPRSHIISTTRCMLERGDDGFGRGVKHPGSYFLADPDGVDEHAAPDPFLADELQPARRGRYLVASETTKLFIQPDYLFVLLAMRHYLRTRWVALLKWDTRPEWHDLAFSAAELVAHLPNSPGKSSFEFDPPPGVARGAGNSWPHALYFRHAEDCPEAVLELCTTPTGSSLVTRKRSRI